MKKEVPLIKDEINERTTDQAEVIQPVEKAEKKKELEEVSAEPELKGNEFA